ncbi:MAG: hypothetical protein J1G01_04450 [Clostridiales bacterium]|nr:hypothetical protein [Clostridiales bacterium]
MARKRMISPEIWESSSFAELTDFAKIVFIGLISNADDEGKGEANPALLKSKLFPRDEKKRAADVKSALSEIARSTSTLFYSVEGHDYYALTTWKRWQKLDRPTPSKIPNPPKEQSVGERGNCMQNQQFDEGSTNTRRILDEGSPLIEKNRKEKNGIEELNKNNITQYARVREVKLVTALGEFSDKTESEALWKSILDKLEEEINSLSFDVWIKPLVPIGFYNNALVLRAPSEGALAEVQARHLPLINKYISEVNK